LQLFIIAFIYAASSYNFSGLAVIFFFFGLFEIGFLCPGTHSVDQAGLELRNQPASASQVLGLKACATMPG
jgi:hypothetical protein